MDNNSQNCNARGEVLLKYFYDYNERQEKLDILKLAGFFGFVVREESLLDEINAKMIISDSKSIIVNQKLEEEYKRYAIAYELSYYFLYYKGGKSLFKHSNELYEDTKVLNLATSLLVRDEDFNKCYDSLKEENSYNQLIGILKEYFCVPEEVIVMKISKLNTKHTTLIKNRMFN